MTPSRNPESTAMGTLSSLFNRLFWIAVAVLLIVVIGYNKLRRLAESVREAESNIKVALRKRNAAINQLREVAQSYLDRESALAISIAKEGLDLQDTYQQSGTVLAAVTGAVQRFPQLVSSPQYQELMGSIYACEQDVQAKQMAFNQSARDYNAARASIPHLLYASVLGFQPAPYLDLTAEEGDRGSGLQSFVSDDGERVRELFGQVGSSAARIGRTVGRSLAEQGKQLVTATNRAAEQSLQPAGDASDRRRPADVFQYLDSERLPCGPVSFQDLSRLAAEGKVREDTLCQRVGETAWVTYRQIATLAPVENCPAANRFRCSTESS